VTYQTCMRCDSPDRYRVNTDGDNGQLHLSGTLKNLRTETYACGSCGYIERYVSPSSLPLLQERAKRV
jgi:hypothetical protein